MATRHQDAGRLGGLQTSLRHGHDHYVEIGHKGGLLGGRPRRLTYSQIVQQQASQRRTVRLGFRGRE